MSSKTYNSARAPPKTPCGISGLAGAMPNITDQIRGGIVLKRLAAYQWFGRGFFLRSLSLDSSRAQRLAASVVWQAAGHGAKDLKKSVLNALRHTVGLAGAGRSVTHALYRVVAQRLAASVVWQGPRWWEIWLLHRPGCELNCLCGNQWFGKGLEAP